MTAFRGLLVITNDIPVVLREVYVRVRELVGKIA